MTGFQTLSYVQKWHLVIPTVAPVRRVVCRDGAVLLLEVVEKSGRSHTSHTHLHLPNDLLPRGDCEICLLLLPPQHEVVVRKRVLAVEELDINVSGSQDVALPHTWSISCSVT